MIGHMSGEPNSKSQQGKAEDRGSRLDFSQLSARHRAYQLIQMAYGASRRLSARLNQAITELSAAEWMTAVLTAVIAGATVWNVLVVHNSLKILQGQLDAM